MPVVSENRLHDNGDLLSPRLLPTTSFFVAASCLLFIGLLIRRNAQRSSASSGISPSPSDHSQTSEKEPLGPESPISESQSPNMSALSNVAASAITQHQASATFQIQHQQTQPPPQFPPPTARVDPVEPMESMVFSSFESYEQAFAKEMEIPRRRSYTKTTSEGAEMSGEIVVDATAGWRRHTKVFGGGVCIACEENERRMSA